MANRTFGWIQNPSSTNTLRNILSLFVYGSDYHTYMIKERLPLLRDINMLKTNTLYDTFCNYLSTEQPIPYDILKGQGSGEERRNNAKCSGLVQAAITGQQKKIYYRNDEFIEIKKPFSDDWTADGFLRWAVSLGFLDYDYDQDTCIITSVGRDFVNATTEKKKNEILGKAFLMYPPVCRVLGLLKDKRHLTKFELGSQLGFTDEAGFTSYPQQIWVKAYVEAQDSDERKKLRSDTEGSSDKYARMICTWLKELGWVTRVDKTVRESYGEKKYNCTISSAYMISVAGITSYNHAMGLSKGKRLPKIVYREMLASKATDATYLRKRRSEILRFLSNHKERTIEEILLYLKEQNIEENETVIKDDIEGFINIGLDIEIKRNIIKLKDEIIKLKPYNDSVTKELSDVVVIKDRVRIHLKEIPHKYLTLIDYAFSSKSHSRDFEAYTIDLLSKELDFNGSHLGGSRKPDGIIYHYNHGVIIDNKAYAKGFTITRDMADEMVRYVQENNERNPKRNKNSWWETFDDNVNYFNYVFISSLFKGKFEDMLNNIKESTGINGCVLTVENSLYFAEALKTGKLSYKDFLAKFNCNSEITCPTFVGYSQAQNKYAMVADERI